jgi:tetratricopeptide (TPR) repeat protein
MDEPAPNASHAGPDDRKRPLAGHRVAFTGVLASMTHRRAHEQVAELGGTSSEHVSRQTTMLVVGEEGWPLESDGQPSAKLLQAQRLIQEGCELRVVAESDWLSFLGLADAQSELRREYTPAMLSQILGVSVHQIRRWERMGLMMPTRRVFRLPYFSFQEAAAARRLADLVAHGVSAQQILRSLERVAAILPAQERSLAQLEVLSRDKELGLRDRQGRLATLSGQLLIEFERDEPGVLPHATLPFEQELGDDARQAWSAGDWFAEGERLAAEGHGAQAAEAFRMSLMEDPHVAETHFRLAEVLYRSGNLAGALERYYAAVELDHQHLEAWTQAGCVLTETGDYQGAAHAFQIALRVHPEYADAHLHLAEALCQLGRRTEAAEHWRRYLTFDQRGPWAEAARGRLASVADSPAHSFEPTGSPGQP